ncbi:MAG: hypothetical protein HFH63_09470 [Lachnospiraceae bacterium]|nr:hypothetical protein [Lachnospiraceae bacterium]
MAGVFGMVDERKIRKEDIIRKELQKYGKEYNKLDKEKNTETEDVILFFSFDVVNSSSYKTINYYGWAQVLTRLFHRLNSSVKAEIDEAELWRLLGDEAIFIVRIKSEDSLTEYVDKIFKILITTIKDLKKGALFDNDDSLSQREVELMKRQNILSLKAAAWIALVSKFSDGARFAENIFEEYDLDGKNKFYEFLGNDIDAGFRICKYTADRRLAISMELAVLLARKSNEVKKLNIITYKHLKGIWKDKYYPIIWYHNSDICDHMKLEDTFDFDSEDQEELILEYFENRSKDGKKTIRDDKMYTNVLVALNKIQHDRNLEEKIQKIVENIHNMDNKKRDYLKSPTLELHCAAICYNEKLKKILIARRNSEKEIEAGKWEFGCAKANREVNLCESIIHEYKEDFGIDIELVLDDSRKEELPVPIALYQIKNNNGLHKGIIVLAKTKNDYVEKELKKHSQIRWIGKEDIEAFEEPAVPDFKSTLKSAFEQFDKMEKENESK